jgi:CO/xanthine dehydrogenase FAD-binding subunit
LLRRDDLRVHPLSLGPRPTALSELDADAVADLSRLDLDFIRVAEDAVHLGALTPLQDLVESPVLNTQAGGLVAEAARLAAPLSLRHVATVGGALVSRDGPPEVLLALLAVNSVVVVRTGRNGETRDMPLASLIAGHPLPPGDLATAVKFPILSNPGVGGALERVARTPRDQAIVAVAALLEVSEGKCRRMWLAAAGVGPRPRPLVSAHRCVVSSPLPLTPEQLDDAAHAAKAEANPVSDFRASAEYRREMLGVLVKRALDAAANRAQASISSRPETA